MAKTKRQQSNREDREKREAEQQKNTAARKKKRKDPAVRERENAARRKSCPKAEDYLFELHASSSGMYTANSRRLKAMQADQHQRSPCSRCDGIVISRDESDAICSPAPTAAPSLVSGLAAYDPVNPSSPSIWDCPRVRAVVLPDGITKIKVLVEPYERVSKLRARLCAKYDADDLVEGRHLLPLDGATLISAVHGPLWLKVRARGGARKSVRNQRVFAEISNDAVYLVSSGGATVSNNDCAISTSSVNPEHAQPTKRTVRLAILTASHLFAAASYYTVSIDMRAAATRFAAARAAAVPLSDKLLPTLLPVSAHGCIPADAGPLCCYYCYLRYI